MSAFFHKNGEDDQQPEDFILYNEEGESDDEDVEISEDLQETTSLNKEEIEDALQRSEYSDDSEYVSEYRTGYRSGRSVGNRFIDFILTHKVLSIVVASVLTVALITGISIGVVNLANPLRDYSQVAVSRESIMSTIEVEGNVSEGNRYNITSLVAGKIILSDYEVGDTVKAGDVLYKIDDTDAKLVVERAQNELDKASDTSSALSAASGLRITATDSGVLKSLNIAQGSTVNAGSQIGTIQKTDGTVAPVISYVSGTVNVVSVSVGRQLAVGQIIATVKASIGTGSNSKYDKKSGEIDVQAARRQLDNYIITAPVDGVITEKNKRVGDNVGITDSSNPMLVMVDTSTLNLTFKVDEYRVREFEKGLKAKVTCDSLPDEIFTGEVVSISNNAVAFENDKPMYEICISISEPGKLKAGMKVKAKVILASANNAIVVPQKALLKTDGQNALVIVTPNGENTAASTESVENKLSYPEIKVPGDCYLISVKYGISDGTNAQILSGVKVGDIVVFKPEEDNNFVVSSTKNNDIKNNSSDKNSNNNKSDRDIEKEVNDKANQIVNSTSQNNL